MIERPTIRLRRLPTDQLTSAELAAIRRLMDSAFGPEPENSFDDDDWAHALGGLHFVLDVEGRIVSHASVVKRSLHVAGRPLRTGYVEAVATLPALQGRGHGSRVVAAVNEHVAAEYELGALGTGSVGFYERLGWKVWRGPTSVRTDGGDVRTPAEDGGILVLLTPYTPSDLDLHAPISCEWRQGDVW
ncbi:MAG TPA: GNAT family N-acetyltransferase [Candidatus Limnocylindria bacterium]|nr:GNAT family N-acetyltransferase [Candidatus Limnocylindria bacterium]